MADISLHRYHRAKQLLGMIAFAIRSRDTFPCHREFWDERIDAWLVSYDKFLSETDVDELISALDAKEKGKCLNPKA